MYSNQTETIGLPQYEGSDKLQRADLNGAFAALDTAVKERPAANADGKYPAAVLADTAANVKSGGLADTRIKAVEDALPGKAGLGADGKLADGQTPAAAKVSLTTPTGMTGKNVQAGINELAGRFGAGGAANNALKLGGTPAADFASQTDMTTVKGYFTNGAANNALKLGGTPAADFASKADMTTVKGYFTGGAAKNALKLGGTPAADFASKADMTTVKGYFTGGAAKNALKLGNVQAEKFATLGTSVVLTLLNGWNYVDNIPSYSPKAYFCGNMVTINGVIRGGATKIWTQIFILPEEMRPQSSKYIAVSTDDGNCAYFISPEGAFSSISLKDTVHIHINCTFGLD